MPLTKNVVFAGLLAFSGAALASPNEFEIVIENHIFTPEVVTVPSDMRIKLKIINSDPTAEEFESHDLNREKIIPGNSTAVVFIGPLEAGEYSFFGEFNEATAQGRIIVE